MTVESYKIGSINEISSRIGAGLLWTAEFRACKEALRTSLMKEFVRNEINLEKRKRKY